MKLDPKRMVTDESRSNPMVVAQAYPECPIKGVCFQVAVGFGGIVGQCEHLKLEEKETQAICDYQKVNFKSREVSE